MRERDIEDYLVKRVKECGGEIRKVRWVGRKSAPDRLVMLPESIRAPSAVIWVELKASGKDATAAQKREHKRMRRFGMDVRVINGFEQVEDLVS